MGEKPLVSVIVPAYNTEKYIGLCLDSLQKQTYRNLEILVIDDGSTDGTWAVCREYAGSDSRFQALHKENSGVSDSRNMGLERAKGKYLVFADSDDYVKPDYVETLVSEAEGEDVQLVCGEFFWVREGKEEPHESLLRPEEKRLLGAREAIDLLPEKKGFQGYICSKLLLTEVVRREQLRFDCNIKIWEDMLFFLQYLTKIRKVSYLGKPIYGYVQREDSAQEQAKAGQDTTHVAALAQMWAIAGPMDGAFHDYVRDTYALHLVALLGKPGFQEDSAVRALLKKIDGLQAKLPPKHAVKRWLYKSRRYIKRGK